MSRKTESDSPRIQRVLTQTEIPHEDKLLSPRGLSKIVGLNEKAVREAMRTGLKHIAIGSKPVLKSTLRWWRVWLEEREVSAMAGRTADELLRPRSKAS